MKGNIFISQIPRGSGMSLAIAQLCLSECKKGRKVFANDKSLVDFVKDKFPKANIELFKP